MPKPGPALAGGVPASFDRALAPAGAEIDVDRARGQHVLYLAELARHGLEVELVPADPGFPDGCFVEDCAVVIGELAVITRPGADSRLGEVEAVAAAVARHRQLAWLQEPARADGGDVLVIGRSVYLGSSTRTNRDGLRQLQEVARRAGLEPTVLPVRRGLHLKSGLTALDDVRLVAVAGAVDPGAVAEEVVVVPGGDPSAANVVRLPAGDAVLVPARHPATAEVVARAGLRPRMVDIGEFHKAGGGLTCLSVML